MISVWSSTDVPQGKRHRAMLELIYGGAASGKSEYAEARAIRRGGKLYYLATMQRGSGSGDERIERHIKRREGTAFITIERDRDIASVSEQIRGGTVLLECLTNLAANELFSGKEKCPAEDVCQRIMSGIDAINESADTLIIVSGNVTQDGVIYEEQTMEYIRLLAMLNRKTADRADAVYEVVCGCPKRLAGKV